MSGKRWVSETLFPGARLSFEAERVLAESATPSQRFELIQNGVFGKMLLLDGAVQVTSADEFIYHEMMAHVPILAHGAARDVLIVGGGDCGLAEEVLKHGGVERLVQVEIDPAVIDFARQHFAEFNAAAFADPRLRIEIADGAGFVARTSERFDVILVDSTDPVGPGVALFTEGFYAGLRRCLKPDGIAITQSGVPFVQPDEFARGMRALSSVFSVVSCYILAVPTYFGGHMVLGWAGEGRQGLDVSHELLAERAGKLALRYWTPDVHRAAFALPRYIADGFEAAVSR